MTTDSILLSKEKSLTIKSNLVLGTDNHCQKINYGL